MMNDEQAARTAAQDQIRAGMDDVAGLLGGYFRALLAQGFEREEAMSLLHQYYDAVNDRAFN